jgi:hypothetical protein
MKHQGTKTEKIKSEDEVAKTDHLVWDSVLSNFFRTDRV